MNSTTKWLEDLLVAQKGLVPGDTNPFYIIAPPYTRHAVDSQVLHSLCHYLNMLGEDAYVIPYPLELRSDPCWPYFCGFPVRAWTNSRLQVKILTQEILDYHFNQRLTPICITPEAYDKPFHAPFIARYILNYPDPSAPKYASSHQFTFSYSQRIAEYVGSPHVLHIPTEDTDPTEIERAEATTGMTESVLRDLYARVPGAILEFAKTVKEEARKVPYDAKIVLPYVCKHVFISADPLPDDGTREELSRSEAHHEVTVEPGFVSAAKRQMKQFLGEWLLPPRVKQIAKHIWLRIRNKG